MTLCDVLPCCCSLCSLLGIVLPVTIVMEYWAIIACLPIWSLLWHSWLWQYCDVTTVIHCITWRGESIRHRVHGPISPWLTIPTSLLMMTLPCCSVCCCCLFIWYSAVDDAFGSDTGPSRGLVIFYLVLSFYHYHYHCDTVMMYILMISSHCWWLLFISFLLLFSDIIDGKYHSWSVRIQHWCWKWLLIHSITFIACWWCVFIVVIRHSFDTMALLQWYICSLPGVPRYWCASYFRVEALSGTIHRSYISCRAVMPPLEVLLFPGWSRIYSHCLLTLPPCSYLHSHLMLLEALEAFLMSRCLSHSLCCLSEADLGSILWACPVAWPFSNGPMSIQWPCLFYNDLSWEYNGVVWRFRKLAKAAAARLQLAAQLAQLQPKQLVTISY